MTNTTSLAAPRPFPARCLHWLYEAGIYLAALATIGVFAVMIGAAVFRLLGLPTRGTNDMVAWLSAAAAFLSLAHTFKHGDLVRVGLLMDKLPARWQRSAELAALATTLAFVGYMAWWAWTGTIESYQFGQVADGLVPMPLWIPQTSFAVGAGLLMLAVAEELVLVARGQVPTYVAALRKRHAEGDFSSDV